MYRGILIGIAFTMCTSLALSATIYVPDNYATIQGAIDSASNGDTVIVRPGTYVENIDFVGKAITVQSEQGASVTTIDGNQAGSVVVFKSGEGLYSVIEGFTLTNGTGTSLSGNSHGGGVYCDNTSSPTITNNIITKNSVGDGGSGDYGMGAGICCINSSSPIISNNNITRNEAILYYGGGIYCSKSSSPIIKNNIIHRNSVGSLANYGQGAGIYCGDSSPIIMNNLITVNWLGASGPYSYSRGGGIALNDASAIIKNNTISANTSRIGGGISYSESSSTTTMSNIISGNSAAYGGGIYCQYCWDPMYFDSNTITDHSSDSGGGFHCLNSVPVITNAIFWNNDASTGPEIYVGTNPSTSTLTISYSDVKGGQSSCYVDTGCTLNWGSGMIDADPLFADAANSDFHLTWNSPCRDTGDNSVVTEDFDFEGDPRIAFGTVDMGADEYYYHLYHMGDVIPGSPIDLKVVGYPTAPVLLALGSGIQDPPLSTQYGDLCLNWPPLWQGNIGTVPGDGVLSLPITVPSSWTSGEEHPLQALVGPWNGPWTWLTNAEVLVVE